MTSLSRVLDAFWRAIGYCLLPRVILLSFVPVLLLGALSFALAWFFWDPAVEAVRVAVTGTPLLGQAAEWLDGLTHGGFRSVIGPLVVVALSVPVLIIASLLAVSAFMGPTVIGLVGRRRFADLTLGGDVAWWQSLAWVGGAIVLALLALVLTLPLWLIPPLALLLPPLILGWLTCRVMVFDVLSAHARADERRELMRRHRVPLLAIGVICGYLGAAPSLIWAFGVMALPMMPLLLPVFVWLYTLVEVLASLWFAHYALAALADLRRERAEAAGPVVADVPAVTLPAASTFPSSTTPPHSPHLLP
ncbi:EI24 domain-containing protein [Sphaerotilus uruguayifluvii]|uniref:EI24 domain-containing protein n=1 Tax=Sphaerotilus uruguayifluvii TaxID=2735897 RepID=A0ABX2G5F3_9BURK|nr:EI24 domain-containing protein [Leptothrix sp. C29]NRT56467.1 hypothetical protein [Leptothrix sp. C29]